jgi:hypothetical protein
MISGTGTNMRINGKPVIDAKKPLILDVTADDIKHSNPLDPAGCAAAVAVMRQEGVSKALVHLSKVYIERPKNYERYEAPRALRTEVIAYDRGGSFEPDKFKLNAISPSQTKEARKQYRLQVPGGKNALPKKSNWKTYPIKGVAGSRPRQHIVTKVRARPSGFSR